jgi:hypothetical protein
VIPSMPVCISIRKCLMERIYAANYFIDLSVCHFGAIDVFAVTSIQFRNQFVDCINQLFAFWFLIVFHGSELDVGCVTVFVQDRQLFLESRADIGSVHRGIRKGDLVDDVVSGLHRLADCRA